MMPRSPTAKGVLGFLTVLLALLMALIYVVVRI